MNDKLDRCPSCRAALHHHPMAGEVGCALARLAEARELRTAIHNLHDALSALSRLLDGRPPPPTTLRKLTQVDFRSADSDN